MRRAPLRIVVYCPPEAIRHPNPTVPMEDLRYPIGRAQIEPELTEARRRELIDHIAAVPAGLRAAVAGLSAEQLDTSYREGGWTVRQVVHHLADSHLNAFSRFKLALTEDQPTIKPYDEQRWVETDDARTAPAELSLALIDALHARWTLLLRSLGPADFDRTLNHPDSGVQALSRTLQIYAWHGRHHTAHITSLRQRMGW